MDVLLVASIDPARHTGGAERVATLLAEGLTPEHDVTVASLAEPGQGPPPKAAWDRAELDLDAPYHPAREDEAGLLAKGRWQLAELYNPTAADRVSAMLDEVDPDVANVHNLQGLSFGLFDTLADHGIPTAYTVHDRKLANPSLNGHLEGAKRLAKPFLGAYRGWVRRRTRHVDRFLSPSHHLAAELEDLDLVDPDRLSIVPNGVPTDVPHDTGPPQPRLVAYGALAEHKGIQAFAEAFHASHADLDLVVAGTGPQADDIQALAAEDERITYAGYLPSEELGELLADALATVVPSLWPENCPMVVLESFAAATPVMHTGKGGLAELAPDGQRGLELPEDPAHWSGVIDTLAADRLAKMRPACREAAERSYSTERMVNAYEQTLTELAGES